MKKIIMGFAAALLSAGLIVLPVSAARGAGFTDTNGNGICDNRETSRTTDASVPAENGASDAPKDRNGVGAFSEDGRRQSGQSGGANYTDEDGDGICDNSENGGGGNRARSCRRGAGNRR